MRSLTGAGARASESDRRHMAAALSLSRRGLGRTWPNPSVGCVIVAGGRVVGRGVTAPGGRPHGETRALAQAGARARGATAYVALEPCAHHGHTPPCAAALAEAGIARVVAPLADPDPRTAGEGFDFLRRAGIVVDTGLMAEQAGLLHAGYFNRVTNGRPLVTLKLAASLDGRVAARGGDSMWITGPEARRAGHALRAGHDAVMVGRNTACADDPRLTCRLPGMEGASPVRVVADSGLRLETGARLVATAGTVPTWVVCANDADARRRKSLEERGVTVIPVERGDNGQIAADALLRALGERGLTRLLVEGGPELAASLLADRLVDRMAWFHAPCLIGADGLAAIPAPGADSVRNALRWRVIGTTRCGGDGLTVLAAPASPERRAPCSPGS